MHIVLSHSKKSKFCGRHAGRGREKGDSSTEQIPESNGRAAREGNAKGKQMRQAYATVARDAARRQRVGKGDDGSGGRGHKKNPVEQIPQGLAESRKTRSIQTKGYGTNSGT